MIIRKLPIDKIETAARVLTLKHKTVDMLAKTIRDVGLIEPPIVRPGKKSKFILVAGLHRIEACRQLGMKEIECAIQSKATQQWASLAEIDENLMRRTLTATERAKLTVERKRLYESEHPETGHGKAPVGRGGKKEDAKLASSFVKDTAAKTGKGKRGIARDAQRGAQLADIADKIVGTSLDKGQELDALGKLPPGQRNDLVERAARGENVTALPHVSDNPILKAWHRATQAQRFQAIAELAKTDEWKARAA